MVARQKRILQVVGAMNMGGAETFLMNILRNINRDDYQFFFLCYLDGQYDYEDEIQKLGGKIIRVPDTRITNPFKFVKNVEMVIQDEQIDVVHSHVDFSSGYAMLAAKNANIKIRIVHAHSTSATRSKNIIKKAWFTAQKWLMNHFATRRIACGVEAGRFMFGKKVFQVVHNGISVKRFQFDIENRAKIRQQLKIDANDTVLLHTGRYETVKNHNFLIDIFNAYYTLDPSAKLILLARW
jgi:glycosyltransferase EpsF